MLRDRGYLPELVLNINRLLRLAGTSVFNGSCFIANSNSHYVSYRLCNGVWWVHDSLNHAPVALKERDLLAKLCSLASGNLNRLGRRLIYFHNPLYPA